MKKIGSIAVILLVLAVVFFAGLYTGSGHKESSLGLRPEVDFDLFWRAWSIAEDKYVDIDKVNRQEMVYGAISGLLKSFGDPYTVFFPPKENKEFQIEVRGEFEGVGMEIGIKKGILTVVAPLKNTPAEKAGIKAGDKILKIDETSTVDLSVEEAVGLIRGPKNSKVKLTVFRNGEDESKMLEIERAVIKIPTLDIEVEKTATIIDGKRGKETPLGDIFVIRLYNFSEDSVNKFRQALREFVLSGKTKLILDLRNNPGGFLEAAVDIASWFLPQGEPVVFESFGKNLDEQAHRSRGYNIFKNLPMVVLINQGSASASEILAGALSDYGLAKLVGERTFGKGSVQELIPLTSDTSLKITIAKWLTPKKQSISEGGLAPDIEVKITKEDIDAGRDPVMEKAIELLKNM